MPNSSSVTGSLSQIMNLSENLKSAILSWSVVIPNAFIGDPSVVFNCINVTCIDVVKLISMFWYIEYLTREMAAPEEKSFVAFTHVYCYGGTICDECYCNMFV